MISVTVLSDCSRRIVIDTDRPPSCASYGVLATRRKEGRFQRIQDIPVAGHVELLWSNYRWLCEDSVCARLSNF
ncbi:putative hydroxylase domain protein [Pseudarthrobacter siccitolerans]|uniref:Putative hydroxylase domain protein n=1 Tax=Pseudarthrobacter siccitolerans TaxID=861266 RepID=A0A024GZJ3_9MICC|nr:putative hydroxylase domain protein [Pseudarthrobacter siccitolerans]